MIKDKAGKINPRQVVKDPASQNRRLALTFYASGSQIVVPSKAVTSPGKFLVPIPGLLNQKLGDWDLLATCGLTLALHCHHSPPPTMTTPSGNEKALKGF